MDKDTRNTPPAISKAIAAVMADVQKLAKTEENKFASYKYAGVDDFFQDLRPKLAAHGLCVMSSETEATHFTIKEKKNNETVDSVFVHYAYDFYLSHEGSSEHYGPLKRSVDLRFVGPQTSGQAQSYCEKMFLRALLKVSTGEKDADQQEQGEFVQEREFTRQDKINQRDFIYGLGMQATVPAVTEYLKMWEDTQLTDICYDAAENRKKLIQSGKQAPDATYGFIDVQEAVEFAKTAKNQIDTMDKADLFEWLEINEDKLKALDTTLTAKKYNEGGTPYERIINAYNERIK